MAEKIGRDTVDRVRELARKLTERQRAVLQEMFAPPKPRKSPQDEELLEGLLKGREEE